MACTISKEECHMAVTATRTRHGTLHPLQEVLLAGTVPLFLGAWLSDYAYSSTYQVQWANFASWLIAGALVFGGLALLGAAVDWRRTDRGGTYMLYCVLLLATWVLGFINALIHARDAWAMMPTGLYLSAVVFLLACVATWLGFSGLRSGGTP
jgi:uncharacterized membrane protein